MACHPAPASTTSARSSSTPGSCPSATTPSTGSRPGWTRRWPGARPGTPGSSGRSSTGSCSGGPAAGLPSLRRADSAGLTCAPASGSRSSCSPGSTSTTPPSASSPKTSSTAGSRPGTPGPTRSGSFLQWAAARGIAPALTVPAVPHQDPAGSSMRRPAGPARPLRQRHRPAAGCPCRRHARPAVRPARLPDPPPAPRRAQRQCRQHLPHLRLLPDDPAAEGGRPAPPAH